MTQYTHLQDDFRGTIAIELPETKKLIKAEEGIQKEMFGSFVAKVGFSVCAENDIFVKRIGRKIAEADMQKRTILVYGVDKEMIQTKKGEIQKTILKCAMPFIQRDYCHDEGELCFEDRTYTVEFDITHVGVDSESRVHIDNDRMLKYALSEKRRLWQIAHPDAPLRYV